MITVENLSFTYPSAPSPALRGLNFSLEDGEILGFLGPSGAGKSTTQKILIRLLQGYEGRAEVLGREVRRWDKSLYEQVGVSFELPNHYARLTALENLRHFAAFYRGPTVDPHRVLDWVGLSDAANERAGALSKGMKVRLNLARACIHRPRLLFLDEPTSGLDPVNTRLVMALVRRLREDGTTVLVTTHNMSLADQLCDRVAFIVDGQIALIDAPDSLKRRHGAGQVRLKQAGSPARQFPLDGLGENQAFLEALRTGGTIESLQSEQTTLDDIFIEVTGKTLHAGDAPLQSAASRAGSSTQSEDR